ncbi:MAG: hypothetical protein GY815_02880 [Gammaproteobacteria bacterium]|nr:hypothetical protein [Gammaproteobacteria bacterium]
MSERQINAQTQTGTRSATGSGYAKPIKASAAEIRQLIKNRIAALEPVERESQKAALIFVESILAWEFGDAVLEDPKFSGLSKEVQLSITESEEHWPSFQKMLRSL